jgi:hypothetical protein
MPVVRLKKERNPFFIFYRSYAKINMAYMAAYVIMPNLCYSLTELLFTEMQFCVTPIKLRS